MLYAREDGEQRIDPRPHLRCAVVLGIVLVVEDHIFGVVPLRRTLAVELVVDAVPVIEEEAQRRRQLGLEVGISFDIG